jgi:hypothetical protein
MPQKGLILTMQAYFSAQPLPWSLPYFIGPQMAWYQKCSDEKKKSNFPQKREKFKFIFLNYCNHPIFLPGLQD